ncbi:2628_t:CDS:2 [Funneliformis geosporum]|uniref:2628_t:CDS:1 n=1 Tax=Funneliformis geosporum TaxID=1117311 RepID=A0A9W4X2Y3_9GLOM|nr:2628_t:CDS:2 [Funneliformis geosporum]
MSSLKIVEKAKLKRKNQYKLTTLGEIVDSKCFPAEYNTNISNEDDKKAEKIEINKAKKYM